MKDDFFFKSPAVYLYGQDVHRAHCCQVKSSHGKGRPLVRLNNRVYEYDLWHRTAPV